jgi:hypothetical protein
MDDPLTMNLWVLAINDILFLQFLAMQIGLM